MSIWLTYMTAFSASVHFRRRLFSLIQRAGSLAHHKFTITLDLYTGSSVYLERELNLFLIFLFYSKKIIWNKTNLCQLRAYVVSYSKQISQKSLEHILRTRYASLQAYNWVKIPHFPPIKPPLTTSTNC